MYKIYYLDKDTVFEFLNNDDNFDGKNFRKDTAKTCIILNASFAEALSIFAKINPSKVVLDICPIKIKDYNQN